MKQNSIFRMMASILVVLCTFAFAAGYSATADTLKLPEALTRIEEEAFSEIHVDYVDFPDCIDFIDENAFKGASFIGRGDSEYAENWCRKHGFQWEAAAWRTPKLVAIQSGLNNVLLKANTESPAEEYIFSEIVNNAEKQLATTTNPLYLIENVSLGTHTYAVRAKKTVTIEAIEEEES